jgi:hypothetical protein
VAFFLELPVGKEVQYCDKFAIFAIHINPMVNRFPAWIIDPDPAGMHALPDF